ncbi:MAG: radical SAM protein [Candidatus Portnoybacteria bacterium]|nr:radical SAM protein [Candidatus Portnoybacteria bacterium]
MGLFPNYLKLSDKELVQRAEALWGILENCQICPRQCRVNRLKEEKGFCQLADRPKVSSFHPHFGEESVLVGRGGSGTIFFTSCNLACLYCQNYDISQLRQGEEISFERLAEMMIKLQQLGCHNINFVTPTPQVPQIVKGLVIARKEGLKIPLVYNTNAYDTVTILKLLEGIIDIYMPDAKYSDDKLAVKYSQASDYFAIMKKAIKEMHQQVGDLKVNQEGIATRGLLIRHLVLPHNLAGSEKIFNFLAKEISPDTFLNIMDQYRPCYQAFDYPELARMISQEEYQEAVKLAKEAGLTRYGKNKEI